MTEKAQRIALTKEMRWQKAPYNDTHYYVPMLGRPFVACDPLDDLNAMHEAEKTLTVDEKCCYLIHLHRDPDESNSFALAFAPCEWRAEAFLRTKGAWVE